MHAEVRLYDRMFKTAFPDKEDNWRDDFNQDSVVIMKNCLVEPSLKQAEKGKSIQFERLGYFCADSIDHSSESPVFNRIVTLRDTWAKVSKDK